jgi:hypothetical protein
VRRSCMRDCFVKVSANLLARWAVLRLTTRFVWNIGTSSDPKGRDMP